MSSCAAQCYSSNLPALRFVEEENMQNVVDYKSKQQVAVIQRWSISSPLYWLVQQMLNLLLGLNPIQTAQLRGDE